MKGYKMSDFKKKMDELKKLEMERKGNGKVSKRPLMKFNENAKKEVKRQRRMTILLTEDEYESLSEQAGVYVIGKNVGTTLSDFIRRRLLE